MNIKINKLTKKDEQNIINDAATRMKKYKEERVLAEANKDTVMKALNIILQHARSDTGGSRRCAQFILSLWNGDIWKCDLQDLMCDENFTQFFMIMDYLKKTGSQLYSIIDEDKVNPVIIAWGDVFSIK